MGLQTNVSYKNFTLSMTFDWRSGGKYVFANLALPH